MMFGFITLTFFLSLTLQIQFDDLVTCYSVYKNPDGEGREVKEALKRLLATRKSWDELTTEMGRYSWKESVFNGFFASRILVPLTGGQCIVNSRTDKREITNDNVVLPSSLKLKGIAMGM